MAKKPLNDRLKLASILEAYKPIMEQDRVNQIPKLFREATIDVKAAEEKKWREEASRDYSDKRDLQEKKKEAFDVLIPRLMAKGVNSPKAIANIMAQIQHESAFSYKNVENPNYTAERLAQVKHKKYGLPYSDMKEDKFAYYNRLSPKEKEIVDKKIRPLTEKGGYDVMMEMYQDREFNEGMPHAGVAHRGRGYTMLTGRSNAKAIQKELEKEGKTYNIVNDPSLINSNPDIAADIAVAYYTRGKKNPNAFFEDIDKTNRMVGFEGSSDPNNKSYQGRVKAAQELQPEVEAYIKQYQAKQKSGGTTKKPKINLIKALTEN